MYYFAYGSNMASRVMQEHCPGQMVIGRARLADYRLAFTRHSPVWGAGVADVVTDWGHEVWGVLYKIDKLCLMALDIKESYGVGYTRIACTVVLDDGTRERALTYTVIKKLPYAVPTSYAYLDTVIEGALEHDLPPDYIDFLRGVDVQD